MTDLFEAELEELMLNDYLNSSSDASTDDFEPEALDFVWYDAQEIEVTFLPHSPPLLYCEEELEFSDVEMEDATSSEDEDEDELCDCALPCTWGDPGRIPKCWEKIIGKKKLCPRCLVYEFGPPEDGPAQENRWYVVNQAWMLKRLGSGAWHPYSILRCNLFGVRSGLRAKEIIEKQHAHMWQQHYSGYRLGNLMLVRFAGNLIHTCCHFTTVSNKILNKPQ